MKMANYSREVMLEKFQWIKNRKAEKTIEAKSFFYKKKLNLLKAICYKNVPRNWTQTLERKWKNKQFQP